MLNCVLSQPQKKYHLLKFYFKNKKISYEIFNTFC